MAGEPHMTPAMEELVVNFLLRMTFLLGDGKDSRDREMVALLKHTQIMFSEALTLWPNVRIDCSCQSHPDEVTTPWQPSIPADDASIGLGHDG